MPPADLTRELIATLPDEPRWIDVRGMLMTGHAQVTGGTDPETCALDNCGFVVKVLAGAVSTIGVVGQPPRRALLDAVRGVTDLTPIVVQTADADWVERCLALVAVTDAPRWRGERTLAHRLRTDTGWVSGDIRADVRLLSASDSLAHLPPGLTHELTHAKTFAPVAALFEAGTPVSFCYPVWRTEALWDVSIDTLDGYRGRGLALHVVRYMIDHLRGEGREPVWCALESNAASRRLAAKLGFDPVAEFVVFSRGTWAILSAGFTG